MIISQVAAPVMNDVHKRVKLTTCGIHQYEITDALFCFSSFCFFLCLLLFSFFSFFSFFSQFFLSFSSSFVGSAFASCFLSSCCLSLVLPFFLLSVFGWFFRQFCFWFFFCFCLFFSNCTLLMQFLLHQVVLLMQTNCSCTNWYKISFRLQHIFVCKQCAFWFFCHEYC